MRLALMPVGWLIIYRDVARAHYGKGRSMRIGTDEMRVKLRNIKTRAAMINAVAERGGELLDEVLPLLQDRHEGVRWSATRILAEVGDERAIGPLVSLLEQGRNMSDAAHALHEITGMAFGDDASEWRRWMMQEPSIRNRGTGGILSDAELMEAAVREMPVHLSGQSPEFLVKVSLPDGRSQEIWVDFSHRTDDGRALVQLVSPCGEAAPAHYEAALIRNMTIPYGALAIASLDDRRCFVVVNSHLRETVHPQDIAESIMSLARHGDTVEQSLSPKDQY